MADSQPKSAAPNLYDRSEQLTYTDRNLDEIAFPLGGIGAGMVSLGGWGQLRDWEIFNHPDKGRTLKDVFFSLNCRGADGSSISRVLQGQIGCSRVGDGHSVSRLGGEGLPHFREVSFTGAFPFASVQMSDPGLPVTVTLEAFNPFIPLNDKDSSIPTAILSYELHNTSSEDVEVLICGNLTNIVGPPEGRSYEAKQTDGLSGLYLTNGDLNSDAPEFGSLVLATTAKGGAVLPRWAIAERHLQLVKFWEILSSSEQFPPEIANPTGETGTVGVALRLAAGESAEVPFVLAWCFPTFEHWNKEPVETPVGSGNSATGGDGSCCGGDCTPPRGRTWKNYYATVWSDAWDVASYVSRHLKRLERETRLFQETLLASTLPSYVLDAVSSQISILKTPTCLRLTDGTFYGFEGCSDTVGCCEGSCTHVWNYAQALPYLFPSLQRSMANAHLDNSILEDGFGVFRMPLPLGTPGRPTFLPAADGQMGTVMQIYREWLISGDMDWLKTVWPETKQLIEFAWKYWDADRDGVMEGMQHNTYDIEFHGPNTMMGSLYLGALRAGEEIARLMGEDEKADEYHALFERGSEWSDKNLFNGEYYEQQVTIGMEEPWPENLREWALKRGRDDKFTDWPRWQFGKGCISDQLIGQWYARMLGLGNLYSADHVKKALKSVVTYNWREDLSDHPCFFRIYAVGDESGLLIGTWPKGDRPGHGFYFADEVWCGIEYQVASHLIFEGFVEEGLKVVRGARERYRGDRRNPWDEIECGHHYSRSMASYSVMLALSGFRYRASDAAIRLDPRVFTNDFRSFFSVESGWGLIGQKAGDDTVEVSIGVRYGILSVRSIELSSGGVPGSVSLDATVAGDRTACIWDAEASTINFDKACSISAGQTLVVTMGVTS